MRRTGCSILHCSDEDNRWALVETNSVYDPGSTLTYDSTGSLTTSTGSNTWSAQVTPLGVLPFSSGTVGFQGFLDVERASDFNLDLTDSVTDLGVRAACGTRLSPRLAVGASLNYGMLALKIGARRSF